MYIAVHANEGCRITFKSNNADALAWLASGNRPDCIVTEFKPGHLMRYEVINYVRMHPLLVHTPILVHTEHDHAEPTIQRLLSVCDGFQYKGVRPDLLVRRIEKLALRQLA
jgi:CheY-like chemotaxis protein